MDETKPHNNHILTTGDGEVSQTTDDDAHEIEMSSKYADFAITPNIDIDTIDSILTTSIHDSLTQGLNPLTMMNTFYKTNDKKPVDSVAAQLQTTLKKPTDKQKPLLSGTDSGTDSIVDSNQDSDVDIAKKCTFLETLSNALGYMMTIAMLSMPYVAKLGGFSVLILLVIICICTLFTALMLDELLNYYSHVNNYSELVYCLLGSKSRVLCAMSTFTELYLYVVLVFILAGDLLHTFLQSVGWMTGLLSKKLCILIMGLLFMPIFQITDLKPMSKISGVGLFGVLATYGLVFIVFIEYQIKDNAYIDFSESGTLFEAIFERYFFTNPMKFGSGLGIMIIVFCFHTLIPNMKHGMQKPKDFRKVIIIVWCMLIPIISMVTVAGYITFGDQTEEAVTSNFTDIYYTIITITLLNIKNISIAPATMFPVTLLVQGYVIDTIKYKGISLSQRKMKVIKIIIPIVLGSVALTISMIVQSFAFIGSLTGSICAVMMTAIFPCCMYVKFLIQQKSVGKHGSYNYSNYSDYNSFYARIVVCVVIFCIMVSIAGWNLVSLVYYGP